MASTLTVSNSFAKVASAPERSLVVRGGVDQHLEPVIGAAAEGAQHDEQRGAAGVVRDLAAADFVEAGDLVEEPRDFRAAVLGEQLHQRPGQFGGGDRELLERLLDRRLGRRAHGEGADDLDAVGLVEIEEGRGEQRRVEIVARGERPGDLMIHLRRTGEGAEIGAARRDRRVGGEGAIDLAAVHLEELGEHDIGEVAAAGEGGGARRHRRER